LKKHNLFIFFSQILDVWPKFSIFGHIYLTIFLSILRKFLFIGFEISGKVFVKIRQNFAKFLIIIGQFGQIFSLCSSLVNHWAVPVWPYYIIRWYFYTNFLHQNFWFLCIFFLHQNFWFLCIFFLHQNLKFWKNCYKNGITIKGHAFHTGHTSF